MDVERKMVFVASEAGAAEVPHDRVLRWHAPAASEPAPIELAEIFSGLD